jgi:uncharacterized membrane protein (UPF0127 family)
VRLSRSFNAAMLACATLAVALALASVPSAAAQSLEDLTIVTGGGRHIFHVEVARTDDERAKGLMDRSHMPEDRGMLFDFKQLTPISMWMKNTVISLDMIFIRADGTISRIADHTEPFSTRIIPSGEPVLAVLELNAGAAERIGAKPGDKVEHPMFAKK